MARFIDAHRDDYGVAPICAVLPIAPSLYYERRARARDPERRPARARRDEALGEHIRRVWQENRQVYGVRKIWKQLQREGQAVARCTVARLMRRVPSTYRSDRLKPPAADIRDGAHRRGAPAPPCPGSVAAHSATPARP